MPSTKPQTAAQKQKWYNERLQSVGNRFGGATLDSSVPCDVNDPWLVLRPLGESFVLHCKFCDSTVDHGKMRFKITNVKTHFIGPTHQRKLFENDIAPFYAEIMEALFGINGLANARAVASDISQPDCEHPSPIYSQHPSPPCSPISTQTDEAPSVWSSAHQQESQFYLDPISQWQGTVEFWGDDDAEIQNGVPQSQLVCQNNAPGNDSPPNEFEHACTQIVHEGAAGLFEKMDPSMVSSALKAFGPVTKLDRHSFGELVHLLCLYDSVWGSATSVMSAKQSQEAKERSVAHGSGEGRCGDSNSFLSRGFSFFCG